MIRADQPKLSTGKRNNTSKGVGKIVKSLARTVNLQIVGNGFDRIGISQPDDSKICMSNLDKEVFLAF
jgi:hypothetical protein